MNRLAVDKKGRGTMNRRARIVRGLFFGAVAGLLLVGPATALEVGQKAPDFTLVAPGNKQVRLADLLGKGPVVIYTFIQSFAAA
jgi:hypothetical protein